MIAGLRRGQENSPFSELEKLCTVGWVDGGGDKWDRLRVRTPILNGGQTQWGEFLFGELLIFTKGEFGTGYKRLLHCLQKFRHPYLHWYFDTLWELLSSHFFVVVLLLNDKILGGNEWIFNYISGLNSSFITILCFANVISNIHIMNLWNSKKYFVRQGMSAMKSRMLLRVVQNTRNKFEPP